VQTSTDGLQALTGLTRYQDSIGAGSSGSRAPAMPASHLTSSPGEPAVLDANALGRSQRVELANDGDLAFLHQSRD
jgi:hypothetical protein